ncbi:MAG: flavin reductase [Acidimicrobiia bacterium]|nr:flavin reductase [Acidimicrobiia bacterium]
MFRHTLGRWATGVAIITAATPDGPVGMTVTSFSSISLEPPLVGFFAASSSSTWPSIESAGGYVVNVLGDDQHHLCGAFAQRAEDRFTDVGWSPARTGAPVLEGVLAWMDCELHQTVGMGDHVLAVGKVIDAGVDGPARGPLLWYQRGTGALRPHRV